MGGGDGTAVAADGGEVNGMAVRKPTRRTPSHRKKQRSWRIPKVLLFLSYCAALVALGSIFFMKTELQRFKNLGRERAVVDAVPEKKTPALANQQKNETRSAATPKAGEITSEEKKQLEDILRSRSGQ
jgi:hypothetical protein